MAGYIDTPKLSEASRLSNLLDLEGLSPEKSFAVPSQPRDLISQMRSAKMHGIDLKTPRTGTRDPLRLLPNGNHPKSEFSPFMKSATKNNMSRRLSSKKPVSAYTPSLPRLVDMSQLEGENTSSSAGRVIDDTPIPQQASSAHSTPLAQLPARDKGGLLNDGNLMTLREQENIIDKIEKENFGLKMKIHFLEEALSKRGNEFNQAALKENTDLKVNRITMQRELHKFKKNIAQAEKDAEVYRLQLEEFKERMRRKQIDESIRIELEHLRHEADAKDKKIEMLEDAQTKALDQDLSGSRRLKDEIEDLQAEVREKDRMIDERDDQIDALKMKASKDSNEMAEVEEELQTAKEEIDQLKYSLARLETQLQDAKESQEEASEEKRRAEEDLDELRDEMANKSFTTKGLSRQLEEKAGRLEDELHELRELYEKSEFELAQKSDAEKQLRERLRDLEREGASDKRRVQQDLEISQQQCETLERKLTSMSKQLEAIEKDLQVKTDEKDLLQNRHDALTIESAELQKDLAKARKSVQDAELALVDERQRAVRSDNVLRTQHKQELDLLHEQIDGLHREVAAKESEHAAQLEAWEAQTRALESATAKAEEKSKGLQRTVDKLQDAQGTLSGRELKLQEAVESEKCRHDEEEKVLFRQISELQQDLATKRNVVDQGRIELSNAKEELRISIREQATLKEKVAELEDEIEILQADIEQEHEMAQMQQQKSSTNSDSLVQKLRLEKQQLQGQLSDAKIGIKNAELALEAMEKERDDLEAKMKMQHAQKSNDDTFNVDHEKRELKRQKVRLEKEVAQLTAERDNLVKTNDALEDEINAELERATEEENRLQAEIESLRTQQMSKGENRDRELNSTRSKVARLEARIKELEESLQNQSGMALSPDTDISELRHDLAKARKSETASSKRESDLKSMNRDLKMRVNDLERELHEANLAQYKAKSPSRSPPPSSSQELGQIRQQLADTQAEVQALKAEKNELKARAKKLTEEHEDINNMSIQLSARDSEAREMKHHLRRLRKERSVANKKAEEVEIELESLQSKYEHMLERLSSGKSSKEEIREREVKGLVKEIIWLKARFRREERLRKDLAWSKGFLEQGEVMRVQCNQVDLRILNEMGVSVDQAKYERKLKPVQKFRAGVLVVMAAIRMSNMEESWRDARLLGEELKLVRAKQTRPRSKFARVVEL
ncbi:hypothetical protein PV10_00039 [Exophiala mesophila]|uniref:Centrosomin N-terminal motif 1 domain-containing protein n=1 Tax=Exophiala mesophila TaxID=212818 RepID=A0A0D1X2Z8_EXOME|nr:uncharacterized protein PV10_00039 [Exophiala mesophila]KIV96135.1 hypothetical protein PV10_00039 [Exophiala mesophila]